MTQNLRPITAITIILVAVLLLSLIFWARQAALLVGGPDQMQRDADGNTVIHIATKLYRVNPSFELMDEVDLPSLGVQNLVGDFAFFANGDVLLRRGDYQPGIMQSLLRYGRLPDKTPATAKQPGEGLYRCSLQTGNCKPFGNDALDFDSAFHLAIERTSDTVYLSDTGRHLLRKFDQTGRQVAQQGKGFRFPNQITLQRDKLLVADTNHHTVQEVHSGTEKFGHISQSHRVDNETLGANIWTYSFARVTDRWWVNNMGPDMSHGSVAIYDDQWQYQRTVALPAGADPIDIAVLPQRVIITDLDNIRIYQLDVDGRLLDLPLPENIALQLSSLRQSRAHYQQLSYAMVGVFVLFLLAGFTLAIFQARSHSEHTALPDAADMQIDIDDPAINWIPFNRRNKRMLQAAMLIPLLLIVILPFAFIHAKLPADLLPVFVMLLFIVLLPWIMRKLLAMRVGILGDTLIIKKSPAEFAAGKGANIFYSDYHILIGNIYIPFNRQQLLFDTQKVVTDLMPLLQDATYLEPGQMLNMIVKAQKPVTLILITVAVLVTVVMFMATIYR